MNVMSNPPPPLIPRVLSNGSACLALLAVALLLPGPAAQAGHRWESIPSEHLNARAETPEAEEAGAEILLVKRRLAFGDTDMVQEYFIRLKLYAERESQTAGRITIPLISPAVLTECGARVLRPDGAVREYAMKDFPQTKAVDRFAGGRTGFVVDDNDNALTFSGAALRQLQIADLQVGDIVEYFFVIRESMDATAGYAGQRLLDMQQEFPIRALEFLLEKDFGKSGGFQSGLTYVNMPDAKLTKVAGENLLVTARNLPAFRREKDMPPERDVRAYIILRLASGNFTFGFNNWTEFAEYFAGEANDLSRPNGAIKKLAAQLTAGVATPVEKLRRLHDYCQHEITNLDYDDLTGRPKMSSADRKALTAASTLEKRVGTTNTINALFAALARAAGLEAGLAATSRARDMLRADRVPYGWVFLGEYAAAVKLDGAWRYYSPGMRWAPFGQLYCQNQGTAVMRVEQKKPVWEIRPVVTDPGQDQLARQGALTLDRQGALTGTVTETLTGQFAMIWRHQHKGKPADKLEEVVQKRVRQHFASAELKDIRIEDDHDNTHPVVLHYRLNVPDYATMSGERIIFAHNALNSRARPRYTDEQRLHAIRWTYGSVITDRMEIQLPDGYQLEAGDAPAAVDFAQAAGIKHTTTLRYFPQKRMISSDSSQTTGLDGKTMFPAKVYPALKQIFERIAKAQTHTLVLKPAPAAATPASAEQTKDKTTPAPDA